MIVIGYSVDSEAGCPSCHEAVMLVHCPACDDDNVLQHILIRTCPRCEYSEGASENDIYAYDVGREGFESENAAADDDINALEQAEFEAELERSTENL